MRPLCPLAPGHLITAVLMAWGALGCGGEGPSGVPRVETEVAPASDSAYAEHFAGFWLGACAANWTGLVTEMDKVGDLGDAPTGPFYTRADWGAPDRPNIWDSPVRTAGDSGRIGFVLEPRGGRWGADDDTDLEWMYVYLMDRLASRGPLTPEQLRDGWLAHILPEEENYLWVSNQRAFDLMREGVLPPATGDPARNEHTDMIDAQLTTEVFGLLAPGEPERAVALARLPIRSVARGEAEAIANYYVDLHARVAGRVLVGEPLTHTRLLALSDEAAAARLPDAGYARAMYRFVRERYDGGAETWEETRDAVYERYQVRGADGYDMTARGLDCNGCFAAGVNFAAGTVSLCYGGADLRETIRIGTLAGWDSDNPTATWGGLLGFALGRGGVEAAFGRPLADSFWIHRTRRGFPDEGVVAIAEMAEAGVRVSKRLRH